MLVVGTQCDWGYLEICCEFHDCQNSMNGWIYLCTVIFLHISAIISDKKMFNTSANYMLSYGFYPSKSIADVLNALIIQHLRWWMWFMILVTEHPWCFNNLLGWIVAQQELKSASFMLVLKWLVKQHCMHSFLPKWALMMLYGKQYIKTCNMFFHFYSSVLTAEEIWNVQRCSMNLILFRTTSGLFVPGSAISAHENSYRA